MKVKTWETRPNNTGQISQTMTNPNTTFQTTHQPRKRENILSIGCSLARYSCYCCEEENSGKFEMGRIEIKNFILSAYRKMYSHISLWSLMTVKHVKRAMRLYLLPQLCLCIYIYKSKKFASI